MMTESLSHFINTCQQRIDKMFDYYLEKKNYPSIHLKKAMYYAVTNGGKRMRPLLVYATGAIQNIPFDELDIPATAIEMIHAYSLIHDDLPAMDNADLRRGKPSCHKAFDEATAILAGDALQTLAFEIIANHPANLSSQQRLSMIQTLAEKSGVQGMAGGQALDMEGVKDINHLTKMYSLKTGALISASIKLAMDAGKHETCLLEYAENLGIAFQLQDDLLDIEGGEELTGKTSGRDAMNQKMTFPQLLGVKKTHCKIKVHFENAINALSGFGKEADLIRGLTEYLFQRKK